MVANPNSTLIFMTILGVAHVLIEPSIAEEVLHGSSPARDHH